MRARALSAWACAGLLAACASAPPGAEVLAGRMSVRVEADPVRQFSSGFELQGHAQAGQLGLIGPLGTLVAQARWAQGRATLTTSEGERVFDSLNELTAQTLGEPLPLAALIDWLRGKPWAVAGWAAHADGLAGFVQLGWHIDLSQFANGHVLARRLDPPTVIVRIKLNS